MLDHVLSDISCHGWRLDPADRSLIAAHPEIFPNFYAPPTPWLDRAYLKELHDFIMNGIVRFRWLLIGLHQAARVLDVFEAWRAWRKNGDPAYYSRIAFRRDFLEFVRGLAS